MSKRTALFFLLILTGFRSVFACELCKSKQPEALKELTHGVGPEGTTDYIIMYGAIVVVLIVLVLSIKLLINPAKADENYQIKYQILDVD